MVAPSALSSSAALQTHDPDTASAGPEPSRSARQRIASGPGLARLIEHHIRLNGLAAGDHLSAQILADRFGASRTPVTEALKILASRGLVTHQPNRGYFVREIGAERSERPPVRDELEDAYLAMARDRLRGLLPPTVREFELRARYGLTRAQLNLLLGRIAGEGWIERKIGYGWAFTEILTTGAALEDSFRMRVVLEPASLLQPGYRLGPEIMEECRKAEQALIDGSAATMPVDVLFDSRCRFHEAIVGGSGNPFFLDAIRRVNRIRRLLSYEAMEERGRYVKQAKEHLALLDLIAAGRQEDAAAALLAHLEGVQAYYARFMDTR